MIHVGAVSTKVRSIESDSIDLIFSSPPNAGLKQKNARKQIETHQYNDWFIPLAREFLRILKPSGSMVLNLRAYCQKGERSHHLLELILKLRTLGFLWIDEYIWEKDQPFQGEYSRRLPLTYEKMFHFAKTKDYNIYLEQVVDKDGCLPGNLISQNREKLQTPLVAFPEQIPEFFLELLTEPGDTVFDPFLWHGGTYQACLDASRKPIGIIDDIHAIDKDLLRKYRVRNKKKYQAND